MVSQRVNQEIEDAGPPPQSASMNNVHQEDTFQDQLNKMKAMMTQLANKNKSVPGLKNQQLN